MNSVLGNAVSSDPTLNWGINEGDEYTFNIKNNLDYTVDDSVFTALNSYLESSASLEDVDSKAELSLVQSWFNRDVQVKTEITQLYSDTYYDYVNGSIEVRDNSESTYMNYRDYLKREYSEYIDMYAAFYGEDVYNATTVAEMKTYANESIDELPSTNFSLEQFALINMTGCPVESPLPFIGVPLSTMNSPLFIPQDYSLSDLMTFSEALLQYETTPVAATGDDAYEENDDSSSAVLLSTGVTYSNLIGADDDWYKFSLSANTVFNVSVTPASGYDVDLEVYSASLDLLDYSSNGLSTTDSVEITVDSAQIVYVKVYPYSSTSPYSLTSTVEDVPAVEDDIYEENDVSSDAKSLTVGVSYNDLVCADNDWFKFSVPANKTFTVTANPDYDCDVDLYVYSSDLTFLDSSCYYGDTLESVEVLVQNAQTIYVKVISYDSTPAGYSLTTFVEDYEPIIFSDYLDMVGVTSYYIDDKAVGLTGTIDYTTLTTSDLLYYYFDALNSSGFVNPKLTFWLALEYNDQGVLNTQAFYVDFSCTLDFATASSGELDITNQPLTVSYDFTIVRDGAPYDAPTRENIENQELGDNASARTDNGFGLPGFPISAFMFISVISVLISMKIYSKRRE